MVANLRFVFGTYWGPASRERELLSSTNLVVDLVSPRATATIQLH